MSDNNNDDNDKGNLLIKEHLQQDFELELAELQANHKATMQAKQAEFTSKLAIAEAEFKEILEQSLQERLRLFTVQKEHKVHQKNLNCAKLFSNMAWQELNHKLINLSSDPTLFKNFLINSLIEASLAIEDERLIIEVAPHQESFFTANLIAKAKELLKQDYRKAVDYQLAVDPLLNELGLIVYNHDKSIRYNNTLSTILQRHKESVEQIFNQHLNQFIEAYHG